MIFEHHDADLCRRLAEKIPIHDVVVTHRKGERVPMTWVEYAEYINWDPCCNPSHSWWMEQKLIADGWMIMIEENCWAHMYLIKDGQHLQRIGQTIGVNRLHALALVADKVKV